MEWSEQYSTQLLQVRTPWGWTNHIRVRRLDGGDGIPWDDLQTIKNELLGKDATCVEVYPAEHELVNEANIRHLWEVPGDFLPFGLHR